MGGARAPPPSLDGVGGHAAPRRRARGTRAVGLPVTLAAV
jgi:hypothetical protein